MHYKLFMCAEKSKFDVYIKNLYLRVGDVTGTRQDITNE